MCPTCSPRAVDWFGIQSAWKEFDRRHHAVVHNTAYDALPSPHGTPENFSCISSDRACQRGLCVCEWLTYTAADQGLQSRSVETPKPREDYFTSRTAQLPTKPAAPNADPFVAFEDENVTTMEAWIQGMNTKANMSMQEAAETGHLLRHQLPGHGSVLKSRPCKRASSHPGHAMFHVAGAQFRQCTVHRLMTYGRTGSVCGLQSQQECPGGNCLQFTSDILRIGRGYCVGIVSDFPVFFRVCQLALSNLCSALHSLLHVGKISCHTALQ